MTSLEFTEHALKQTQHLKDAARAKSRESEQAWKDYHAAWEVLRREWKQAPND